MIKIAPYLLVVALIFLRCSNTNIKNHQQGGDYVMAFNYPYQDSIHRSCSGKDILKEEWQNYEFNKAESFTSDFTYKILGKSINKNIGLSLLSRCYNEENIHWLALMKNNKLVDYIVSAYDNSEGFRQVKSEISQSKVVVKEWNDFNEINYSEKKYTITKNKFLLETSN